MDVMMFRALCPSGCSSTLLLACTACVAAGGKQVKSVMTRMAVPKCHPFAMILCLVLSSGADAVKLSGKWWMRSFTRMLGVTSSPLSFSHKLSDL